MARPTKYEQRFCDMVIEHMSEGASLTSFAAEIGVCRATITVWMDEHPEFLAAVKSAKAKCAAWWERLGRLGAAGGAPVNPTLVIFGLKNMSPDDWRDKQEIDHTTNGKDIAAIPDSEIDRRIAELLNANSNAK